MSSSVVHYNFEGGRLVEEIEVNAGRRLDGELAITVTRWSYDAAGRPERAVETYESGSHASWGGPERGPHWRGKLYRLRYDDDGELAQISCALSGEGLADGHDVELAQAAAIAGEATLFEEPHLLYELHPRAQPERAPAPAAADPEAPLPERARHDRAELAAWLTRRGVGHGDRVANEVVSPGFRLVQPAKGQPLPRTRIGGPGLLPPETRWPTTGVRDRPLDFLAIVDLAELRPTVAGGAPLPEAGCLLFYADLGPEQEGSGDAPHTYGWFGEPAPNEEGAGAQVLWVAPGEEPVDATAPRLPGSQVPQPPSHRVARHELVIFDTDPIGVSLGFEHHLEYRPLQDASFETRGDGTPGWIRTDWVLGGAVNVNALGEPGTPNPALLLHLDTVDFQDAGSIEFRIPFDALARGDWSQAFAVGESA